VGSPKHEDAMMQPSLTLTGRTLAEIVTDDARAAGVFDRLGLDYCCRGQRTLQEAAIDQSVPLSEVVDALTALGPRSLSSLEDEWTDLSALTRHIVTRHHAYAREARPLITSWLDKLATRHGDRHPELIEVRRTFLDLADELAHHMRKEENILFPYIDTLAAATGTGDRLPPSPFGTVVNPIRVMEDDHEAAGVLAARLRQLTDTFTPPPDGCTTFRLCYQELARYEADLHRHIHLENNILFPRAIALEDALS
jgi:regulator of cell morphogenesis and NO signaling